MSSLFFVKEERFIHSLTPIAYYEKVGIKNLEKETKGMVVMGGRKFKPTSTTIDFSCLNGFDDQRQGVLHLVSL
jgi:hypothetical protein